MILKIGIISLSHLLDLYEKCLKHKNGNNWDMYDYKIK